MAHELTIRSDGIVEAMYANKPAWHGLGVIFDPSGAEVPDSDAAFAGAHLDWEVRPRALYLNDGKPLDGWVANCRSDNGNVLGVVGDGYAIVQNREAFDFLDSLQQDGIVRYESAFSIRGGAIVCILARLPSVDDFAADDKGLRYVLFSTSHDGTARLHALPTSVRVVCANTYRAAISGDLGLRHSGDMKAKLNRVRQYLSQFDSRFTMFRDKARVLAEKPVNYQAAKDYLLKLFPPVEVAGRAQTIRDNKRKQIVANFADARSSGQENWWALYNSVSYYVDHQRNYKGSDARKAEQRFQSTMDGDGADFKEKAFDLALESAGVAA